MPASSAREFLRLGLPLALILAAMAALMASFRHQLFHDAARRTRLLSAHRAAMRWMFGLGALTAALWGIAYLGLGTTRLRWMWLGALLWFVVGAMEWRTLREFEARERAGGGDDESGGRSSPVRVRRARIVRRVTAPLRVRIYALVRRVPKGRVATYGQIARLAGIPRHARQVGYALHALAGDSGVPWHRVLNSRGAISLPAGTGPDRVQRKLLEAEGVRFGRDGRVDLARFQWRPRERR